MDLHRRILPPPPPPPASSPPATSFSSPPRRTRSVARPPSRRPLPPPPPPLSFAVRAASSLSDAASAEAVLGCRGCNTAFAGWRLPLPLPLPPPPRWKCRAGLGPSSPAERRCRLEREDLREGGAAEAAAGPTPARPPSVPPLANRALASSPSARTTLAFAAARAFSCSEPEGTEERRCGFASMSEACTEST